MLVVEDNAYYKIELDFEKNREFVTLKKDQPTVGYYNTVAAQGNIVHTMMAEGYDGVMIYDYTVDTMAEAMKDDIERRLTVSPDERFKSNGNFAIVKSAESTLTLPGETESNTFETLAEAEAYLDSLRG